MERIPKHIIESCILPKLPVKSLLRLKSVSKFWQTLISSNDFILENRVHIFPGEDESTLHLHYLDSPLAPVSFCPYPTTFPKQTFLASCEFFLLIISHWDLYSYGLILLNPFTRIYREIPDDITPRQTIPSSYPYYVLYLDEENDDLKVVRVAGCSDDNYASGWEITIFSVKTNLWRLIETKLLPYYPPYDMEHRCLCVNKNLFYTIFHDGWRKTRIGCFDIRAEEWINDNIPLPPNSVFIFNLCVFEGFLCALGVDKKETSDYTWTPWIMMKDNCWVELMTIASKNIWYRDFRPIAYRKGSRHEILCRRICDAQLFWYNLNGNEITSVVSKGVSEYGGRYNDYFFDHLCKESLMSFPGGPHPQ